MDIIYVSLSISNPLEKIGLRFLFWVKHPVSLVTNSLNHWYIAVYSEINEKDLMYLYCYSLHVLYFLGEDHTLKLLI